MLELYLGQVILVLVVQCVVSFITLLNILGITVLELFYVCFMLLVELLKIFDVLLIPNVSFIFYCFKLRNGYILVGLSFLVQFSQI